MLDWALEGKRKKSGKPKARCEDEINDFMKNPRGVKSGDWRICAACKEEWAREEEAFSKAYNEERTRWRLLSLGDSTEGTANKDEEVGSKRTHHRRK